MYPPPAFYPGPPRNQKGLGGTTIFLIILALLVMIGGFGLIYYTALFHPAQLHAQATATAQVIASQATATANTQASATAQANVNATATAQAVATAQVVATATALQSIYSQATSGTPVLDDSLQGNSNSNWDVGNGSLGGSCGFSGGAYQIVEPNKNYYLACRAQSTSFSNFAFQVKMTILKGGEGGMIFRADSTSSRFYTFGIARDGTFSLIVSTNNNPGKPLVLGPSAAIHTGLGQPNVLTVVARGSTIYLYVNQQFVDSVHDTTYHSGEIGLYAAYVQGVTDVAFNDAKVWQL